MPAPPPPNVATTDPIAAPTAEVLPRPLTPRARRQSWREPSVRVWWLMFALILVAFGYLVAEQAVLNRSVRHRLVDWRHQKVVIDKINNSVRRTYHVEPQDLAVDTITMSYADAKGTRHELSGHLTSQRVARNPGDSIELLLNPADLSEYSDRVTAAPLSEQLVIPAILTPFLVAFLAAALLKRRGVLRLWRDGARREAEVIDVQKSALSPRSSVIRATVPTARERRIFRLTIPRALLLPQPGDTLQVITPPGEPTRAIAAMLYD